MVSGKANGGAVWPAAPMLAKAVEELPPPDALRGGCQYEPKWDGYRGLVGVWGGRARIRSRNGTDLTQAFDDVAAAAEAQLPDGTLLDGELVVWHQDRLDFSQLQRRVIAPTRAAEYAREAPASFVAFDVLSVSGKSVGEQALRSRRELLDDMAEALSPPLQVAPATTDLALARQWLDDYAAARVGIEGLVIKGLDEPYRPGRRSWLKLRTRDTVEAIIGAVTGSLAAPERLILGLFDDDARLIVAGGTSVLSPAQQTEVLALLEPAGADHPWPSVIPAGRTGAFGGPRELNVTRVVPDVVIEIAADSAYEYGRWRHLTRFLRARPDLAAADVPSVTAYASGNDAQEAV